MRYLFARHRKRNLHDRGRGKGEQCKQDSRPNIAMRGPYRTYLLTRSYRVILLVGILLAFGHPFSAHAQQVAWVQQSWQLGSAEGKAIAVAADGETIVTGAFQATEGFGRGEPNATDLTSAGDTDIFMARYAADGHLRWAQRAGGSAADRGTGVALDQAGNSYLVGTFSDVATFGEGDAATALTSRGGTDLFLAKFDEGGQLRWVQPAGGAGNDRGAAIAVDAAGAIYVTGTFAGAATFAAATPQATTLISTGEVDLFVAHFATDGTLLWVNHSGGTGTDQGSGIAVDGAGNSYVTGSFVGVATFGLESPQATSLTSSGGADIFVARFATDGGLQWVIKAGGNAEDYGAGIAVDAAGSSTVTGALGAELYVARYNANGNRLWLASAGGGSSRAAGYAVAMDHAGNSYVAGEFTTSTSFSYDRGGVKYVQFGLINAGASDGFLATYNADGSQMWARTLGGALYDGAYGVAADATGVIYVTGSFTAEAAIHPLALSGAGTQFFAARFAPTLQPITVNTVADPGDGLCTADECTLREALALANSVLLGENTIAFQLPGPGPHTIQPTGDLPDIVDRVLIDGYTQPGAQPNTQPTSAALNTTILVEIDGSRANRGFNFTGNSWNSVIRGLAINRFRSIAIDEARRVVIEGNFIGVDPTGTIALGNGTGVDSAGGIGGTTPLIGGANAAARNLIAGNGVGVAIGALSFATVEGNFIGTDRSGTQALGNGVGVSASNCVGCELGRLTLRNNLIAGNGTGARSTYTCCSITGNLIGTDRSGQAPLPNTGDGLVVSSYDMGVGGNVFAYNGGSGVRVVDSGGANAVRVTGNRIVANGANGVTVTGGRTIAAITGNIIADNGLLGIDLNNDGVTANDVGDGDAGPNLGQNYPLLQAAGSSGATAFIQGAINSRPNRTLTLEFYANAQCDPSGNGEGERLLISQAVTTNGRGDATFTVALPLAIPPGQAVSATASDLLDSSGTSALATSEFAACQPVAGVINDYLTQQAVVVDRSQLGAGLFVIDATFRNHSATTLRNGFFRVSKLAYQRGEREPAALVVRNAMSAPRGTGALVAFPAAVEAGATFTVRFEISLPRLEPFDFYVDGFGLPTDGFDLTAQQGTMISLPFELPVDDATFVDNTGPFDRSTATVYLPLVQR